MRGENVVGGEDACAYFTYNVFLKVQCMNSAVFTDLCQT